MGSYSSKKEENFNNNQNNIFNQNNLNWLRKQVWAWILLGIFIMSVFFYIAKGLIVIIGGTVLGIYLYSLYGKDNPGNDKSLPSPEGNNTMLNTTVGYMKQGVNTINNAINTNHSTNIIEGFEGRYKLFSNIWWNNSR